MKLNQLSKETQKHIYRLARQAGVSAEEILRHFNNLFSGVKVCTHSPCAKVFATPVVF